MTPGTTTRRLAMAAVLAVLVALVPGAAFAKFSRTAGSTMSVGTATLGMPSTATLSKSCPFLIFAGSLKVTFPDVPLAESYLVTLDPPSGTVTSKTVTSGGAGATFSLSRSGTYDVTVVARVSSWTGPALSRSFTC
ncbi:hypothetical protein SAMN04489867_2937 [Pedococcus dokdonensis]|uniref:Uncharacterized protein n=1 Tax=Pedococcus dokdonensis TaxID=443156 RepID=A0A1H0TRV0_9MICO|nr:hypothetical protein [Pedococcus dokdonensis]SDP56358.1 hypothetical protein SAMN04489867_2937 [Pedococcus dokdonensis]